MQEVLRGQRGLVVIALGCSLIWLLLPAGFALAGETSWAVSTLVFLALVPPAAVMIVAFLRWSVRRSVRALTPEGWNDLDVHHSQRQLDEAVMAGKASPQPDLAGLAAERARRHWRSHLTSIALGAALALLFLFEVARGAKGWPALVVALLLLVLAVPYLLIIRRLRRAERLNRQLSTSSANGLPDGTGDERHF